MSDNNEVMSADVVLVGAGIMSTTLAVFLKELQPHLRIAMIERMPGEAQESSGAWNNAGTGHAANCELNYTPMRKDGSVDIAKALEVNVEFDMSRQFWSYLIGGDQLGLGLHVDQLVSPPTRVVRVSHQGCDQDRGAGSGSSAHAGALPPGRGRHREG